MDFIDLIKSTITRSCVVRPCRSSASFASRRRLLVPQQCDGSQKLAGRDYEAVDRGNTNAEMNSVALTKTKEIVLRGQQRRTMDFDEVVNAAKEARSSAAVARPHTRSVASASTRRRPVRRCDESRDEVVDRRDAIVKINLDELANEREIVLHGRGLNDDDLDSLLEALSKSKILQELWLSKNYRITLAGSAGDRFSDALAHNHTLRALYLYNNSIGDEGAKRLADALIVNRTLKEVWLSVNRIGDEGARHLAGAIMINETLQTMGLSENSIGDLGANHLATGLMVNSTLRVVGLRGNKIGDKGAEKLASALRCNKCLENLYLEENHLGSSMQAKIESILDDPARLGHKEDPTSVAKQWVLKDVIRTKNKEIKTLTNEIKRKDKHLKQMTKIVARAGEEIERKDRAIASKDKQIANLTGSMDSIFEAARMVRDDERSRSQFLSRF